MLAACGVAGATELAATALAHRVYIVFVVASGGVAGIVVVVVVGVSVFVVAVLAAAAVAVFAVVVDVDVDIDVTVVVVIYYFCVACFNLFQQVQPSLFIQHARRAGTKHGVFRTLRPPCRHAASRRNGWELL